MPFFSRTALSNLAVCAFFAGIAMQCGTKEGSQAKAADKARETSGQAIAAAPDSAGRKPAASPQTGFVNITSEKHLDRIMKSKGDTLLVFDMYADWCMPCRMLDPILKDIAKNYTGRTLFYKVNIDFQPEIASQFKVTSIPLIVFAKNNKVVLSLAGFRQKEAYIQAIEEHGLKASSPAKPDTAIARTQPEAL